MALSRNFHASGTWLSQHKWETSNPGSRVEGTATPAAASSAATRAAQRVGSELLPWAALVTSRTFCHTLPSSSSSIATWVFENQTKKSLGSHKGEGVGGIGDMGLDGIEEGNIGS